MGPRIPTGVLTLALCISAQAADDCTADTALERKAAELRAALERDDVHEALEFVSPNPRRWWGSREGPGRAWRIGPDGQGPWAAWDEHFRSRREILCWSTSDGEHGPSVTAKVRETNDYYQLLERGWATNLITYYFDADHRIEGLLVRATDDRPMGRTAEFLSWAEMHASEEIAELMPDGEIDPSGDHPRRFRALLERWREGLEE